MHRGDPGSIPIKSVQDLWQTKRRWHKFVSDSFGCLCQDPILMFHLLATLCSSSVLAALLT